MATLTVDRHPTQRSLLDPHEDERAPRPPQPQGAPRFTTPTPPGRTLDDLVAGTWDELTITHASSCVVCGGDLTPRWGSGPHPVAADCRSCGSHMA